jgi:23S rRNA (pseudouridine1915-N3)-methyltransferase
MKLVVVAVGQRMPDWAQEGTEEFAKRMPPEWHFAIKTVKAEPRGSATPSAKGIAAMQVAEAKRIEETIASACGKSVHVVALDERGKTHSTKSLAQRLEHWQIEAQAVALVIGGPDGLSAEFKASANEMIRLSDLTLPHAMARMLLVEALYRAWSVNANHPYHRE